MTALIPATIALCWCAIITCVVAWFHALITNTDRYRDSEETEREPVGEGSGEIHILHINPYRLNQEQDHG